VGMRRGTGPLPGAVPLQRDPLTARRTALPGRRPGGTPIREEAQR
jgi:hypothetical protein